MKVISSWAFSSEARRWARRRLPGSPPARLARAACAIYETTEGGKGGWQLRRGAVWERRTLRVVELITKLDGALEADLDDLLLQLLQPPPRQGPQVP